MSWAAGKNPPQRRYAYFAAENHCFALRLSRRPGFETAIRVHSTAETMLSPPPSLEPEPRASPFSAAACELSGTSPRHRCEISMRKGASGRGCGALRSPCAPRPWPSGRETRAGACAQACLVGMSASLRRSNDYSLQVMLPPRRKYTRTAIAISSLGRK